MKELKERKLVLHRRKVVTPREISVKRTVKGLLANIRGVKRPLSSILGRKRTEGKEVGVLHRRKVVTPRDFF